MAECRSRRRGAGGGAVGRSGPTMGRRPPPGGCRRAARCSRARRRLDLHRRRRVDRLGRYGDGCPSRQGPSQAGHLGSPGSGLGGGRSGGALARRRRGRRGAIRGHGRCASLPHHRPEPRRRRQSRPPQRLRRAQLRGLLSRQPRTAPHQHQSVGRALPLPRCRRLDAGRARLRGLRGGRCNSDAGAGHGGGVGARLAGRVAPAPRRRRRLVRLGRTSALRAVWIARRSGLSGRPGGGRGGGRPLAGRPAPPTRRGFAGRPVRRQLRPGRACPGCMPDSRCLQACSAPRSSGRFGRGRRIDGTGWRGS